MRSWGCMSDAEATRLEGRNAGELFPLLYQELRRLASAQLARMRVGGTLQPTVLVHEAYLKLAGRDGLGFEERRHFFGAAAQAMREIVIDHARRKRALKRGGGERHEALESPAIEVAANDVPPADDVLAVNAAIERLEAAHPRKARVAILRYFGGLSVQEIAEVMGVTTRTIEREWRFARAFLLAALSSPDF